MQLKRSNFPNARLRAQSFPFLFHSAVAQPAPAACIMDGDMPPAAAMLLDSARRPEGSGPGNILRVEDRPPEEVEGRKILASSLTYMFLTGHINCVSAGLWAGPSALHGADIVQESLALMANMACKTTLPAAI